MRRRLDGFASRARRAAWIAPALALAAMLGCEREQHGARISAGDIMENPDAYVGKQVTVGGEVNRTAGARAFTLEGGIGSDLLVLNAPPRQEGEDVVVSGQVRLLTVAEVERELGWDLEREIEVEFAEKPVLIASETTQLPGDESAAREGAADAGAARPPA